MKETPPGRVLLERMLNRMEAFSLSRYLDAHGIPVTVIEPALGAALGDIPFLETATELILEDPQRLQEALALIDRYRNGPTAVRGAVWKCAGCGETHDPEFGACWKCGRDRS